MWLDKVRWGNTGVRWVLNPVWLVSLYKEEMKNRGRDTQEEYVYAMMEAEIRVMLWQAKEHQGSLANTRI